MTTTDADVAVKETGERLSLWVHSLRTELDSAIERFDRGGDTAASSFASLLVEVLEEHRAALDQYKVASAPVDDRLRWLQLVGSGLALIVFYLERLDGAIAPRLSPLVSAFENLLHQLVPGNSSVFRQFREFNYELNPIYADDFRQQIGDAVERYSWPSLLIKFPIGLLDSPRNHILVAHEIGHAVAAANVADLQQQALKTTKVGPPTTTKTIDALWPQPIIPSDKLIDLVLARWVDAGFKPLDKKALPKTGTESLILAQMTGSVAKAVRRMSESWLEELFSDALGVCLFGPAFVLAFIDVLMPVSGLAQPDRDHPSPAARLLFMESLLNQPELGDMFGQMPPKMKARVLGMLVLSKSAMAATGPSPSKTMEMTNALVSEVVEARSDDVRKAAILRAGSLLYTSDIFASDLKKHANMLVEYGVPPVSTHGDGLISLASIFNVAQFAAMEQIERFRPDKDRFEREALLDNLVLKAVELSEVQRRWESVP